MLEKIKISDKLLQEFGRNTLRRQELERYMSRQNQAAISSRYFALLRELNELALTHGFSIDIDEMKRVREDWPIEISDLYELEKILVTDFYGSVTVQDIKTRLRICSQDMIQYLLGTIGLKLRNIG